MVVVVVVVVMAVAVVISLSLDNYCSGCSIVHTLKLDLLPTADWWVRHLVTPLSLNAQGKVQKIFSKSYSSVKQDRQSLLTSLH